MLLNTSFFRFSVSPSHSLVTQSSKDMTKSNEKLKETESESVKELTPVTTPTSASSGSTSSHKNLGITVDSIQEIPPFRPRKSREWTPAEVSLMIYIFFCNKIIRFIHSIENYLVLILQSDFDIEVSVESIQDDSVMVSLTFREKNFKCIFM